MARCFFIIFYKRLTFLIFVLNIHTSLKKGHKNMANGIYNLTEVVFCFGDWAGPCLSCGYLRNDDVYEYMKNVKSFVPSRTDCIQSCCDSVLSSNMVRIHDGVRTQRSLYIVNKNPGDMKCPCGAVCAGQKSDNLAERAKQCMKNIESGKCKEKFIIENIGKVFFADKYQKDNQK